MTSPARPSSNDLSPSPTSTYSGSSPPTNSRLRQEASRSSLRHTLAAVTPARSAKTVLRSDPSLLTSFDPKDVELYACWVPS